MRAVVSGATSFIGVALCRELLQRGHEVFAVARASSPNLAPLQGLEGIAIVHAGMDDWQPVVEAVGKGDIFFHLAWEGTSGAGRGDAAIQARNLSSSLKAVEAAHQLGCGEFVMFGSQAEYGRIQGVIIEESEPHPETEYGKAKLAMSRCGAALCRELGMRYLHLRIFSIYGRGDHPWTLVMSLVRGLSQNEDVELSSCAQMWNFLYIGDAARMIARLAESGAEGVFNIASADTRPLKEFVEEIKGLVGGTGKPLYGARQPEKVVSIEPSTEKLRAATGNTGNTTFAEGVREIVNTTLNTI